MKPEQLAPRSGFPERERLTIISGIRIITNQPDETGKINLTSCREKDHSRRCERSDIYNARKPNLAIETLIETYNRRAQSLSLNDSSSLESQNMKKQYEKAIFTSSRTRSST
jgi:hypothetical protein